MQLNSFIRPIFAAALLVCVIAPEVRAEATPKSSIIRVLVADSRTYFHISIKGDYAVRAYPGGQVVLTGNKLNAVKLVPTAAGFRLGNFKEWPLQSIVIEPKADRDLYLDDSRFRGSVRIQKSKNGLMMAINRLDMEKYLYGVLHHEVAPWWPMEALKAQAIASRTYATYQMQVSKANEYDVKSSTASQVYGGSTTERYRSKKAVDKTAGQILTFDGKVFPAYFHATCAGKTAAAKELWNIDLPPIAGGAACNYCRISPHTYWQAKVPLSTIEQKMNKANKAVGQILKIEPVSQTPSGRVGSLKITGNQSEAVVAAKDFRVWVGGNLMKSTFFTVDIVEDLAEFHGKGWGHGVGLCQWGTLGQSLLGKSHREILGIYYPHAEINDYRESQIKNEK